MTPELVNLLLQSALVFLGTFLVVGFWVSRHRFTALSEAESPEQRVELAAAEALSKQSAAVLVASEQPLAPLRAGDQHFQLSDGLNVQVLAADPARLASLLERVPSGSRYGLAVAPIDVSNPGALLRLARERLASGEPADLDKLRSSAVTNVPDQSRYLDAETGVLKTDRIGATFMRFIRRARSRRRRVVLLQIALDDHAGIRSLHGEAHAASAVRHLAQLLQDHFREDDLIARLAEHEFVVVLEADEAGGREAAQRVAQRIREIPCAETSPPLYISACFGVAIEPIHGRSVNQLLDSASFALEEAQKAGPATVMCFHTDLMRRKPSR